MAGEVDNLWTDANLDTFLVLFCQSAQLSHRECFHRWPGPDLRDDMELDGEVSTRNDRGLSRLTVVDCGRPAIDGRGGNQGMAPDGVPTSPYLEGSVSSVCV